MKGAKELGMERTDDEEFDKMMDHILEDLDKLGDAETDEISPGVRALFRALSEGSAKANEEYAKQSLMVNSGAIAMFRRIIRFFKSLPMENGGNAELVESNMKPQLTPNSLEFRVPYLLLSGDSCLSGQFPIIHNKSFSGNQWYLMEICNDLPFIGRCFYNFSFFSS